MSNIERITREDSVCSLFFVVGAIVVGYVANIFPSKNETSSFRLRNISSLDEERMDQERLLQNKRDLAETSIVNISKN